MFILSLLSVGEAQLLVDHQARQLLHMCRDFVSPGTWWSATVFFRACCARWSLLEQNPETLLFCAILVAVKAEE